MLVCVWVCVGCVCVVCMCVCVCVIVCIKVREFQNEIARRNVQTQQQTGIVLSGITLHIGKATSMKQSLLKTEQKANYVLTAT